VLPVALTPAASKRWHRHK